MKYKSVIIGLLLIQSVSYSSFLEGGWVSRYSSDINISAPREITNPRVDILEMESSITPKIDLSDKVITVEASNKTFTSKESSNPKKKSNGAKQSSSTFTSMSKNSGSVSQSILKKYVEATQASGLISLYKKVDFEPVWLKKDKPKDITKELFNTIKRD